mgnify:CR=1 FL=1
METINKMHIETPKQPVPKSQEDVFNFLVDIKNFEKLMPENINKFEVLDEKTFKFALKGMPEIILRLMEKYPNQKLVLGAPSKKLSFTLTVTVDPLGDSKSEVGMDFQGEFNAMMAMMIKTPITNFMDAHSTNMPKAI